MGKFMEFSEENLNNLKSKLTYDPETGFFHWKIEVYGQGGYKKIGDKAGTSNIEGRCHIGVAPGQYIRNHTLAYWFMEGKPVPKGMMIDHRDRDDNNNKWENLRLATKSINNHNSNPPVNNRSGVKGVCWMVRKDGRKYWDVRIHINKKTYLIGGFKDFKTAVEKRIEAEIKYLGEITSVHAIGKTEPDYNHLEQTRKEKK